MNESGLWYLSAASIISWTISCRKAKTVVASRLCESYSVRWYTKEKRVSHCFYGRIPYGRILGTNIAVDLCKDLTPRIVGSQLSVQ